MAAASNWFGTALVIGSVAAAIAQAELPPQSAEALRDSASIVVVGRCERTYSAVRPGEPGYRDTVYAIELRIEKVEKGKPGADGQTLFVKAWRAKQRPEGWVGPSGQSQIPGRGDTIRVYARGEAGDYHVLLPNGLAVLKAAQP